MAAQTIDEYLAAIPPEKRAALEVLRGQVRAAAPEVVETISYGLPAFRLDGRFFVGFGATKQHCSFYAGRLPVDSHADELTDYRVWKGTINFAPDRPLPPDLVTRLVVSRLEEYRRS